MDVCQICLRSDKKLKVVDTKLSEFHDELCEYDLACTLDPLYCKLCEHMLRKVYNFKNRCSKANKILQNCKKSKTPKNQLYTLLPTPTLGKWQERNARVYMFTYSDQPMLTINGNQILPIPNSNIKLEDEHNHTDQVAVPNVFNEKEISIRCFSTHCNVTDAKDPLMTIDDIKVENDIDNKIQTVSNDLKILIETDNVVQSKDEKKRTENVTILDLLKSGDDKVETLNDNGIEDAKVEHLDDLLPIDLPDDASLNSEDDCDSDDFVLNDLIYNKRKSIKENQQQKGKTKEHLRKTDCVKKSLLELANMSISDDEFLSDETEEVKNIRTRRNLKKRVVKKVDKGKVTKKKWDRTKVLSAKELEEYATGTVKEFCDRIPKRTRKMYNRARLIVNLTAKFKSCGELKTEDGTVIDKECILNTVREVEPAKEFRELWDEVRGSTTLTAKAISLLNFIENKDNEYKTVFDIQYLNTEEKMLEEFEKRRTYKSYVDAEFKCDHCLQWFKFKKLLEYHMKWHDEKSGEFACPVCKTRRKTRVRLMQHMKTHKTVYKCKLCPLVTNYRGSMLNHFRQHQGVEYKCELCNLTYKSKSSFNTHRTKMCTMEQRNLVCTYCARTFMHNNGLKLHIQLKHRDELPIDEAFGGVCTQCSLVFASKEVFEKHLWISHKQGDAAQITRTFRERKRKPGVMRKASIHTCRVCNANGTSYGWLTLHFELEHPTVDMASLYSDKAKVLCDVCGKGYSSVYALRDHMNVHSGARPFTCSLCPATFRTRIYLTSHRRDQHAPPRYACSACHKRFRSKGNLYYHMRTHIGDRRFKCSLCGKGFLHRGSLKEHIRGVHDNVRRVKKPGVRRGAPGGAAGAKEPHSDTD